MRRLRLGTPARLSRGARLLPGEVQVRFGDLPVHAEFTLYEARFINITFIKVSKFGAQIDSWDNESLFADQRFPEDALVWTFSSLNPTAREGT